MIAVTLHANPNVRTLTDIADTAFDQAAMELIGTMIPFGIPGVRIDVERWLQWMLAGGSRPKATQRSLHCPNGNVYCVTQNVVCAMVEAYVRLIDWNNKTHFALIERITRPSPGTTPLVQA